MRYEYGDLSDSCSLRDPIRVRRVGEDLLGCLASAGIAEPPVARMRRLWSIIPETQPIKTVA